MMFSLEGKTALVTGGGTGIGLAVVKAYLEFGAFVYISGRRPGPLEKTVEELSARYPDRIAGFTCDNQKKEDIEALARRVTEAGRGLDVLVNNAGVQYLGSLEEMPEEQIDAMFRTNVQGMLRMSLALLPLLKVKGGKVINMSSFVAEISRAGVVGYSATKGAMRQFTKGMAIEWAPYNIQVNAIMPGTIVTGFNPNQLAPAWRAQAVKRVPAGRLGAAEDCAGTAVFLASSASDYVTGVSIAVDGGILAGA